MKTCCNFCSMMVLTFFALMLSMGSLQAQTQANCDLTKCSPEERAACAKRCASTASATTASLTDFLFASTTSEKPTCNPVACAKTTGAMAKLVSTETKTAPTYTNSLDEVVEQLTETDKKKNYAMKCNKKKTSL